MKKVLFSICGLMPGGFILLGAMILFVGCARLQYQEDDVRIVGYTTSPEAAMYVAAKARAVRARAYAVHRCADDPRKCGGEGWGYGGRYIGMYLPVGYGNWVTGSASSSSVDERLDHIVKEVETTKEGLREFFRDRGKNTKRAKAQSQQGK